MSTWEQLSLSADATVDWHFRRIVEAWLPLCDGGRVPVVDTFIAGYLAGVRATSSQPHMAAADEAIKRWLRQ